MRWRAISAIAPASSTPVNSKVSRYAVREIFADFFHSRYVNQGGHEHQTITKISLMRFLLARLPMAQRSQNEQRDLCK